MDFNKPKFKITQVSKHPLAKKKINKTNESKERKLSIGKWDAAKDIIEDQMSIP